MEVECDNDVGVHPPSNFPKAEGPKTKNSGQIEFQKFVTIPNLHSAHTLNVFVTCKGWQ